MKTLATTMLLAASLFLAAELQAQALPGGAAGLPNPASAFCIQCGGNVDIQATPLGETGVCVFPGGFRIEEWALWRMFNPQPAPMPVF